MYLFQLLFFFFTLATSCQDVNKVDVETSENRTTLFSGEAMTMQYKIIVGQTLNSLEIEQVSSLILETFEEVNQIYNKWNPNSELSSLNNLAANQKQIISQELYELFKKTELIVFLSQNRFDPTIEPLQALWKAKLNQHEIPNEEEISLISPAIGWHHIHFQDRIFYKDHDLTKLDLGGIAKGLAIDLFVKRLQKKGYPNLFVEWGGEIKVSGQHPENRPWTIFISRLGNHNPEEAIDTLYLTDQAIATSGDYLQNWSINTSHNKSSNDSKTTVYFHIFDPLTLSPLKATHTSVASVSVVCNDCAIADGLATSAMLFRSVEEANLWADEIKIKYPEISFWILSRDLIKKHN